MLRAATTFVDAARSFFTMRRSIMRPSILALFASLSLIACGQDDDDVFAPPELTPDAGVDMADVDAPDEAPDEGVLDQGSDLPPRPPELLAFTFWRRDDACPVNNCVTELRLGVRAGNFERLRGGQGLGPIRLDPEEHARARALLDTEAVRDTMKAQDGWQCPEAAPDSDPTYGFYAALLENNREKMWYHSVTGCVQSEAQESSDAIVEFMRELQTRYYP
jgi:hypothetical protein